MKKSLALYLILTTLQVHKIGATSAKTDYICGENVVSQTNINASIEKACSALYQSKRNVRYPALYDASSTFLVSDARLFSWPIMPEDKVYQKGRPGNLRLIMDSSCKFFGIIMKFKYFPDRRCYRPVEPPSGIDESSNSRLGKLSAIRGYNCKGMKPSPQQIGLKRFEKVDKLFEALVFVLPSETITPPDQMREMARNSYFTVIDSQYEILGMVYNSEDNWEKCEELWEMKPERRRPLASGINSIGERLFEDMGDYQCGSRMFSREAINSHMQVACNIFQNAQKYATQVIASRLKEARIRDATGELKAWKFPLQLHESVDISRHESVNNNCVIILDKWCNFLGAYQYDSKIKVECKRLQPQDLPAINDPKVSTPGSSFLDVN